MAAYCWGYYPQVRGSGMAEQLLKLLLIDADPVFRMGLRLCLEQSPNLQVVEAVETGATAWEFLAAAVSATQPTIDLVILDLNLEPSTDFITAEEAGFEWCQRLRTTYPNLPILLLSQPLSPDAIAAAQHLGIEGYCPKGTSIPDLLTAIQQIAAGQPYWPTAVSPSNITNSRLLAPEASDRMISNAAIGPFTRLRQNWRLSGLQQIDAALAEVTAQLQQPSLDTLERAVLAGRWRELKTARWLINHLLATPRRAVVPRDRRPISPPIPTFTANRVSAEASRSALIPTDSANAAIASVAPRSAKMLQATLFDRTTSKLQSLLQNLTNTPLEIDILREEKRRELLYTILRQLENILDELRFSQVPLNQLLEKQQAILQDLWQATTIEFFGKYSTLRLNGRDYEIVSVLRLDAPTVQVDILNKIPLVAELFAYLLFQIPLTIDNETYGAESPEAQERAEAILQNLLVQVANAVIQPLLNHFADVEIIKQNFYDRRLISTREIERFRNSLSWRYRLEKYVGDPKAIFESQHPLFVLDSRGIAKVSVYAPRTRELRDLTGLQLAVTLVLETRDAVAPRVRAAIAFVGSGLVYVLTEVVGRGIGLVGRGILQGIGSAWQDTKISRDSDRLP